MIYIGKAPYRVSLLGGGSDLDWFVKSQGYGVCLGYSLDQYSYSVLNILPSFAKKGILEYSTREEYRNINEIVHPMVREVLISLDIPNFIELKTFGFASGGSGLGGSASFLISLILSISKAFKLNMSKEQIIEKACLIEIKKLNKSIGKQDQYLCSNKGFSSFTFHEKNESVKKNHISTLKINTLERLAQDFYLIPTNKKRNSNSVLKNIKKDDQCIEKFIEIRKIATQFIEFGDERDYKIEEFFNFAVKESWLIKKSMSQVMSDQLESHYELINKTIPNNWIRLIGAGNGGYFLISSKIEEDEIFKLSNHNGIKGIFKAKPSNEGLSSIKI
jgi:D-glycero-alpha-D-manno-heptose-7-phosphate kinase